VAGAAVATALGQCVGGLIPFVYFARKNSSKLSLVKTRLMGGALFHACTNGSSELVSNVSMSLVGMLYNLQLMKFAGENGVAAWAWYPCNSSSAGMPRMSITWTTYHGN
jgi:Na+-driven multidrug efflux pump